MIEVHLEDGKVSTRQARTPRRKPGEALLHLRLAGICNTDLELQRGYYGFRGRPGHEFVADVVETDNPRLAGRRVVGEINLACGRCEWCARGLGRHCPHRKVLGIAGHPGAFAEYFTLPEENLHRVPAGVPDEEAVFTEPVAAACEILDQVRLRKGDRVGVLGDGKLGLLIAQVLRAHGAEVHLFGRHRAKLNIARRAGIHTALSRKRMPVAEYGVMVEATGSAGGLTTAIGMTRPRGTVVLKSTVHDAVCLDTAAVVVHEITLIGSRCGRFQPALRLLRQHKLELGAMISDRYPLSEAPQAFARAAEKGVLKVLLTV